MNVLGRNPRCPEIGVDVPRQHVFGLDDGQRLGVAFEGRSRVAGVGEFVADIAREIGVGGFPFVGFGIAEDQVAQFLNDLFFRLAVQLCDEVGVNTAVLVERNQQSLLGRIHAGDRGMPADHVFDQDRTLGRLAGDLVVILERHHQHGVGVFPELHEVGHSANDRTVGGFAEGGFVDRSVFGSEAVIGQVQFSTGFPAIRLGPALVLGAEHPAGPVPKVDQGAESSAGHRAVGFEFRAAVNNRQGLSPVDLTDHPVIADEETPLADVLLVRRWHECRSDRRFCCFDCG